MRILTASALLLTGCLTPEDSLQSVEGRDDLAIQIFQAEIRNGLSNEMVLNAPEGLQSVLMEVRGEKGLYYLTKFKTPAGDLIEGAQYTTRFAREVPGLVDWLYPNSPTLSMDAGEYKILLRGETTDGSPLSEDIEVRLYAKKQTELDTCGVHLDFLVDKNAIDAADFEVALDRAVEWVNNLYAPTGIRVIDYQITQVNLPNPNFDVESTTVTNQVDDVLRQARASGNARTNSLHVMVVRTIGGSEPAGYAMGLPGPFDADRSNAAVLVSTDAYTDGQGFLDVEGMASTIAHEMGHYMGLYHTSESSGLQHDPLPDTPTCDQSGVCSSEFEQNIMSAGGGSSRIKVTDDQAFVIKQHPLCVPKQFDVVSPTCDLSCDAPSTCSVLDGTQACRQACDQADPLSCGESGDCSPDDMGTFVCQ
jgi:hypothetical protein